MKLKILHQTTYSFDHGVFLEPHYFRFKPVNTTYLQLKYHQCNIEPAPSGISNQYDVEDNEVVFCWFDGAEHEFLQVQAESVVEISSFNPFNFIIFPMDCQTIPFQYEEAITPLLSPGLQQEKMGSPMKAYVNEVLEASNSSTVDFLIQLTRKIHADFELEFRLEGDQHPPEYTFQAGKGACRDLSWMQIQMLRYLGLAARFVSGYFYIPYEDDAQELHAWVEVFMPGAGWVGLDPSHGIFTNQQHIPVTASFVVANTMPVIGSIRGNAKSTLKTELSIQSLA
jgi:transglutaminase-like putative cysteine protease